MDDRLWSFIDSVGSFEFPAANKIKSLYFTLANENIMSSISPDLHGDIKTTQDAFLLSPVSRIDLVNSRSSRNFWCYVAGDKIWSATGVSCDLKQIEKDTFNLKAGLLWQEIERQNKEIGLKSKILSFVPATGEPVEIMQAEISNISPKEIKFIPILAIPIYGRSAANLRDHRHVSSLLQRVFLHKFGVISKPTLIFDEAGHRPNKTAYFVLGWDQDFNAPVYLYPTQEMFCQDGTDLEAPAAVFKNLLPAKETIQGKEAMGALRFGEVVLESGQSRTFIVLAGITQDLPKLRGIINNFNSPDKVKLSFEQTKDFWVSQSRKMYIESGEPVFDNWFHWVSIQPALRKIFGCSFLPDFDYGKGGRGWRDLWQDCISIILNNPQDVRRLLINNFSGVRIDGSNATIIGKDEGEFISDRNNLSRVWMDHGVWPLISLDLYINETGDFNILFEKTAYFRNHEICRSQLIDSGWRSVYGSKLKTLSGKIYKGTILEHLLAQSLVQFFNVGSHNHIRLEGADWNDGLDMAKEKGESVAFSAMYAKNLKTLSDLLVMAGRNKIKLVKELKILLAKVDYNNIKQKLLVLDKYFRKTKRGVSGDLIEVDADLLACDLKKKSEWIKEHICKKEWLKQGFFNGYYDNTGKRLEGRSNNVIRMLLSSQVFPIMSGVATDEQIKDILKNVDKYLLDKKLGGLHLNTDFKQELHSLGRAFSFVYGEKENGAFFNHMTVMFAYALYRRGFVDEAWRVLRSIYNMALDTARNKIYPCLPEYFNLDGRGMYSYLTGSASWFVLTLFTEVFGIKASYGQLLIEPKLSKEQFKDTKTLSVWRNFAQRSFKISFSNPRKIPFDSYKITQAVLNGSNLKIADHKKLTISRNIILGLPKESMNTLDIILG